MNYTALYALLMVPLGLIVAYVARRRRQRVTSQPK